MENIKLDEVQNLLDSGKDPEEVLDLVKIEMGGFRVVRLNGKWNYLDKNNKLLSSDRWFDWCGSFDYYCYGVGEVNCSKKINYINRSGELLSPVWADSWSYFYEGIAAIKINDGFNFVSAKRSGLLLGDWVQDYTNFHRGGAMIKYCDKYNFIDTDGKLLYERWFDDMEEFHGDYCSGEIYGDNTRAIVELGGKKNYVKRNGKLLSPDLWFDDCWWFTDDEIAMVELDNKYNLIRRNGELLLPDLWVDKIFFIISRGYIIRLNDKENIIDKNGKLLLDRWVEGEITISSCNSNYDILEIGGSKFIFGKDNKLYKQDEYIKIKFNK